MVTQRETTQIAGRFLTRRAKDKIRVAYMNTRMLGLLLLIVGIGAFGPCLQAETNAHDGRLTTNPDWSELIAGMRLDWHDQVHFI